MNTTPLSEVDEATASAQQPPLISPHPLHGLAIQDDLLADFGLPAAGTMPKQ